MIKLIVLLTLSTGAFAQEVIDSSLFVQSKSLSSGLPTNIASTDTCPKPGESKNYDDVNDYLKSVEESTPAATPSSTSFQ